MCGREWNSSVNVTKREGGERERGGREGERERERVDRVL